MCLRVLVISYYSTNCKYILKLEVREQTAAIIIELATPLSTKFGKKYHPRILNSSELTGGRSWLSINTAFSKPLSNNTAVIIKLWLCNEIHPLGG